MSAPASSSGSRMTRSYRKRSKEDVSKMFNPVAGRPFPKIVGIRDTFRVCLNGYVAAQHTTSASVPVYTGVGFALNTFDKVTEYTALFDQYKFEQIEVWLTPNSITPTTGEFVSAVDLDDTVVSSVGNVSAKQMAIVAPAGGVGHYHKWLPCQAVATYQGALTGYKTEVSGWNNCAYPAIEMFGLKIASLATGSVIVYDMTVRAVVSFRGPGV